MKKLPDYAYVPGVNARPEMQEPRVEPIDPASPERNEAFQYGLALFRNEYYWESHVYFEALWKAHQKKGSIAQLLKGLIALAAAGVNFKQGRSESAKRQWRRAVGLIDEVQTREGPIFLGLDLQPLKEMPAFLFR